MVRCYWIWLRRAYVIRVKRLSLGILPRAVWLPPQARRDFVWKREPDPCWPFRYVAAEQALPPHDALLRTQPVVT